MARKDLIKTPDYPYHVFNRSNNKEYFYIDQEDLWSIFMDCLHQIHIQFSCEIHYFVLMSNHYHLIISTPKSNLGDAMKYLHREVARKSNKCAGRINHFFGGRYKWCLIDTDLYLWNCIKYVLRNPVQAGLCEDVAQYDYSSLNRTDHRFTWQQTDFFNHLKPQIQLDQKWLNEPFESEIESGIQKALRRRKFEMPRSKSGRMFQVDKMQYKKGTVT